MLVAVGTYSRLAGHVPGTLGRGVYTLRIDESGRPSDTGAQPLELPNPTYLVRHPSKLVIYACQEMDVDVESNAVTAISFDERTGVLTAMNTVTLPGGEAVHVDTDGEFLFAACLEPTGSTGVVHMLPLAEDGSVQPICDTFEATEASGKAGDDARGGSQAGRQDTSHPHQACLYRTSDGGMGVLVPDLGGDVVYKLAVNKQDRKMRLVGSAKLAVGTGPRHCVVDTQGANVFYVIAELTNTIDIVDIDSMTSVQRVSTLPAQIAGQQPSEYLSGNPRFLEKVGQSCSAAVKLSPDGKKLYGSNRGHDSLTVCSVDGGRLKFEGCLSTRGRTPRDFLVGPNGKYLLAVNQDSGTVATLSIDDDGQKVTLFEMNAAAVSVIALTP
mmetsp:Transcript_44972/g.129055  ORF Transcript_44972/g.129055 Transcript_44972/m.129055 type:complete len:384 (+) Transcript_44972:56-1207(+)